MKEIWKDIEGYENRYQISNLGRVKSLNYKRSKHEKILKNSADRYGYIQAHFRKDNKDKMELVHRLVMSSFKGNIYNMEINHIDGNKQNNSIDNLELCTRSQNIKHAYKIGLSTRKGESNKKSKLKEIDVKFIRKLILKGRCIKYISNMFNVSESSIRFIKDGRTWKWLT